MKLVFSALRPRRKMPGRLGLVSHRSRLSGRGHRDLEPHSSALSKASAKGINRAAEKAGAERLVTFDRRDFEKFAVETRVEVAVL